MGIKIDRISVKSLGPIQSFSEEFGLLNLIYSKNERGKTFLTEFIIRSLFKNINIKRWKFREGGSGNVLVSGLDGETDENVEPVEFSPSSRKKLEDYWEKDETGLPASMVKLLVSKGGEASIENTEEGIDKSLIKEIFSGISLLDKIDSDNNISKTVRSAQLLNGNIDIKDTGEGRAYRELKAEINQIDRLFEEIESKYTRGILESYKAQQESLKGRLDKLHKAKCHQAYLTSEKIKELSEKLKQIPDEKLNEIATDIALYEGKKNEFMAKNSQLSQLQQNCRHFEWLQKALPAYEKLTSNSIKKPKIIIPFLSGVFAAATVAFILLVMPIGAVISQVRTVIFPIAAVASFLAFLGLIVFYIIRLLNYSKYAGSNEELNKIKKEYKNRVGKELTDVATLSAELDKQRESYDKAKFLKDQLDVLGSEREKYNFSIQQKFASLTGKQIKEEDWHLVLNEKIAENRNLKADKENLQSQLVELKVSEAEYLHHQEDAQGRFSCEEFEEVKTNLDEIGAKISDKEQDISNLKYGVCNETKDDPSIDWEQLFENLKKKRLQKQNDLNVLEAKITAGIIVHDVISELRQEEDFKILQGLQSEVVLKPLKDITRHYNKLSLDGERLIVSDDYRNFYLQELSTGAREQIMLALRIGFSSKLLKKDTLFLILDDAFQHSDWDRRKILIKQLSDIAKTGWQIIYLTMDDHIKELFDEAGKEFKSGQYKCFDLALGN
ncbi:MAG: hypothetical protein NTV16_02245 [Actinobacteria bacterium]|nr:hypothetical protein [Actinomycetota bacterium]